MILLCLYGKNITVNPLTTNPRKMQGKFYKILSTVVIGSLLIHCTQPGNAKLAVTKGNSANAVNDSTELTGFIRKLYRWHETKSSNDDFNPITGKTQDTSYVGIDWDAHSKRIKELEATNFFSKNFLDNYSKIAQEMDTRLKNGSKEWLVGDMPPFGNDANPWCNCQDYPDKYWDLMTVTNIKRDNTIVSFKWTWDNESFYDVVAVRIDNSWKIEYLQGFDSDSYLND